MSKMQRRYINAASYLSERIRTESKTLPKVIPAKNLKFSTQKINNNNFYSRLERERERRANATNSHSKLKNKSIN